MLRVNTAREIDSIQMNWFSSKRICYLFSFYDKELSGHLQLSVQSFNVRELVVIGDDYEIIAKIPISGGDSQRRTVAVAVVSVSMGISPVPGKSCRAGPCSCRSFA